MVVDAILESTHPIAHNSMDIHRIEQLVDEVTEIIALEAIALNNKHDRLSLEQGDMNGHKLTTGRRAARRKSVDL